MKPIRVLMVVRLFYPWVGGTEGQAYTLSKELIKRNVKVEIVTGWWFRGTAQREVMDGIPVFRNQTFWEMFGIKGLRRFGGYLYIFSLLWHLWRQRADYDILHVHGLNYHAAAAVLAGRWFDRRTVVKLANSGKASDISKMRAGQQLPLSRYLLPTALQSDRFVATSEGIMQELMAAGVPAGKILRLTNGVDLEAMAAKSGYVLHDPVRLVFVGRLHEQKRLDILLMAFEQLLRQDPARRLCLQLLGDGPVRNDLMKLAHRLGIAEQTEFVGMTQEVPTYLQHADIFVLPSRAEGNSNALLEAMACGLPVVVSDIPANTAVVEHGRCGLTFRAGDPESLTQAVRQLLDQAELRAALGMAARQLVESQYRLQSVADSYISLYESLLPDYGRSD
jgi:glycosyltransferase involved in cell wall biosynthesis